MGRRDSRPPNAVDLLVSDAKGAAKLLRLVGRGTVKGLSFIAGLVVLVLILATAVMVLGEILTDEPFLAFIGTVVVLGAIAAFINWVIKSTNEKE